MNYTLKEFLRLLHNKEPICFINNKKIIKFSKTSEYNGVKELHYIPNTGGTKDQDITRFNTYFIDLDCGRDKNKEYFDLDRRQNMLLDAQYYLSSLFFCLKDF